MLITYFLARTSNVVFDEDSSTTNCGHSLLKRPLWTTSDNISVGMRISVNPPYGFMVKNTKHHFASTIEPADSIKEKCMNRQKSKKAE